MSTATQWVGQLAGKKKEDLTKIAEELGLTDLKDLTKQAIVTEIQNNLDANATMLSADPKWKGLYKKKKPATASPDFEGEVIDVPATVKAVKRKVSAVTSDAVESTKGVVHKGVSKLKDAGIDPSRVPLPDSPASAVRSLRSGTNSAVAAAEPAAQSVITAWKTSGKQKVVKYAAKGHAVMSNSNTIIQTMVFLEFLYILYAIYPSRSVELQFPPSQWSTETWKRGVYQAFSWVPEQKLKVNLPGWFLAFGFPKDFGPIKALSIWFLTTLLVPYTAAHLVSYMSTAPAHTTRSTKPRMPQFDPFVFSLLRLVILIFPMTSASPDLWRSAMEAMGDLQGKALGGFLTFGMVVAERLGGL